MKMKLDLKNFLGLRILTHTLYISNGSRNKMMINIIQLKGVVWEKKMGEG